MSAVASSSAILPISGFPAGVDMHWETRRRVVWNEQEHAPEEHEAAHESAHDRPERVGGVDARK